MKQFFSLFFLILFLGITTPVDAKKKQNIYYPPKELLAEVTLRKAAFVSTPNADSTFELAMSYAYTGQIERGWFTLRKIPDYDPDYAPKVLKKYQTQLEEDPENWKTHFSIAFGYFFAKQKNNAIQSFEQVLKLDPKNIWAMSFIGLVKGEMGEVQPVIDICKRALKIEPNATATHFLLAEAYRRDGQYMMAFKHMMKVGQLKTAEKLSGIYDH